VDAPDSGHPGDPSCTETTGGYFAAHEDRRGYRNDTWSTDAADFLTQQAKLPMKVFRAMMFGALFFAATGMIEARADEGKAAGPDQSQLVKQANAPISSIMQIRLQDTFVPQFNDLNGSGNTFTMALTMPLPKYRLLPLPQLSLLTLPAAVKLPGYVTGLGDLRFLDIAIFNAGPRLLWGVGPMFVFPTASKRETGQGKWQVGPAAAVAFVPERWLVGVLVQNPISFAGDGDRKDANAMIMQPFVSYQLGKGWFVRSQPQIFIN
jgi:hypothetical protein